MEILFLVLLFMLGACLGSFLCCQARRLHLQTQKNRRSVCLYCSTQLKWYDNIPIVSWLMLKGKCRYCHRAIGCAELLSELLLAFSWLALGYVFIANVEFVSVFLQASPLDWAIFLLTLLVTLPLAFLAIYDGLYGELPLKILVLAIGMAAVLAILKVVSASPLTFEAVCVNIISGPLAAAGVLSGTYLVLYLVSKGKWVGDGDWLLALAGALVLGSPWLALIALFLTNAIATVVYIPFLVISNRRCATRKKARGTKTAKSNKAVISEIGRGKAPHQIYLGPFLVIAFVVTLVFATQFLSFLGVVA